MDNGYRVYGYRWVVLASFMLINVAIQVLWISYAPITGPAAAAYGVSDLAIGFLSMSFMIAYVPLSIPVSWLIDTVGFRKATGFGAVLMAVFGVARGVFGGSYAAVLACTIGLAAAQPFMLNAWTKVPARWFPPGERATAVGLVTLSSLVGAGVGLALTPVLTGSIPIPRVQLYYGLAAALSTLIFLVVARERPATPPCSPQEDERALMLDGLKHAFRVPSFRLFLVISFIGFGIFNGVTTWVESIVRPRGFSPEAAGLVGAVMLAGGVLGAVVIPAVSDRVRLRLPFLLTGLTLTIPGLLGVAFAVTLPLLLGSAFFLGFFLVSINPVGMQYVAEITYPTPEGTSNGLIQLFGQGSIVFVYIMEALRTPAGSFTPALMAAGVLLALCAFLVLRMSESRAVVQTAAAAAG